MTERPRISRMYTGIAVLLLNTLVVLVIVNLVAWGLLAAHRMISGDDFNDPVTRAYGADVLARAYPDRTSEEIRDLLRETWSRPVVYEPFTQFRERTSSGTYVNVHEAGFRHSANQGPWPPDPANLNIFVFGGSTTFGYGVADDETVASYLQAQLSARVDRPVCVYNFGRGFYFSSQERLLAEQLARAGHVPDVAIFVDGLNEFYYTSGIPEYTDRLTEFMEDRAEGRGRFESSLVRRMPISRLIREIRHAIKDARREPEPAPTAEAMAEEYDDSATCGRVIDRYLANRTAILGLAGTYGFQPVLVWQPAPTYRYSPAHDPFAEGGFGPHTASRFGYRDFRARLETEPLGPEFVWCADLQEDLTQPLYVDKFHYAPTLADRLAAEIAQRMVERALVPGAVAPGEG